MNQLIIALFFSIGFVVATFTTGTFVVRMLEKWSEASNRKLANDKRLLTLLETINQKLDAKP